MTEMVILSVGLNNCLSQQQPLTAQKQLQQLMSTCRQAFPNAEIYLPLIVFSDRLSRRQQELIELLNQHMDRKYHTLPGINKLLLQTERHDPVHWTQQTADKILTFWLDQLNM